MCNLFIFCTKTLRAPENLAGFFLPNVVCSRSGYPPTTFWRKNTRGQLFYFRLLNFIYRFSHILPTSLSNKNVSNLESGSVGNLHNKLSGTFPHLSELRLCWHTLFLPAVKSSLAFREVVTATLWCQKCTLMRLHVMYCQVLFDSWEEANLARLGSFLISKRHQNIKHQSVRCRVLHVCSNLSE